MSKLNFRKMTRVVAGVTLVTATTMGCSEDATTPNVITEGINYIPCEFDGGATPILKSLFTIPNFIQFLNQYSNDLPAMVNVLTEFEQDCYSASHKYFYLSEILSNRIYILQSNYDLFTPIAVEIRNKLELAIADGSESLQLEYVPDEDSGWNNFDWNNPPAATPNAILNTNLNAYPDDPDRVPILTISYPIDCCLADIPELLL